LTKNKIAFAFNIVLTLAILGLLALKLPTIIAAFNVQGTLAPDFSIQTSDNSTFTLSKADGKKVLIFWATWCPPCEVELERINELVKVGKIPPDAILAIAINDDPQFVNKVSRERGYLFKWACDANGEIADQFKVRATPSMAFIDGNKKIAWMTSGYSPTLSWRLASFLD
jgi:cytochrome c biogenesis protein CcmG, thiol:disulfide interchange protein DsbE